jgi:hypothetical protein
MTNDRNSWDHARAQAEELLREIASAEMAIVTTIERECDALRAGCMLAARALHTRLCDSVKFYLNAIKAARASLAALEQVLPGAQEHLEERRAAFSSLLKVELAVLASEYAACGAGGQPVSFTGESLLGSAMVEASKQQPAPQAARADVRRIAKRLPISAPLQMMRSRFAR